ncbi:MAG: hypothetical protein CVU50_09525 [Candidatus Cloacimonetes bacterium HGW-Cloacimonetes-3]|jgi:outer membrane protein assembly factor BamA|nr:MAG: hypothetical protein CVU50_09525 [Candidatus Cloacimonetes bacterium HGW-Cloacimonetes-3]
MSCRLPVILLLLLCIPLAGANIGKISFTGMDNQDEAKLQKASGLVIGQAYDPGETAAATLRLYSYFSGRGQYFVHISAPELIPIDADNLELSYALSEIIPSEQVNLHFQGMQLFSEDKIRQLLLIPEDSEIRLEQIPRFMQQLISLYHNRSYLFAKVQLDSLVLKPELTAYIGINEGKPLRIKEYIFRGNKVTRESTLLNITGLAHVKSITPAILTQAEENILRKSYIRDCLIEPIDESSLLIRIEEHRMTYMEGIFGMNSKEGELQLSGQIRLQFLNLWGTDRAINLWWKQIPSAKKELSLAYHESGFPGIPVAADIELFRSEQDSTWVKSRAALAVYYQMLNQKLGVELVGESITPGSRRPAIIESSNANSAGAFWDYLRLEGGSNPVKGVQFNLRYRYQNGADNKLHAAMEAGSGAYFPLGLRLVGFVGVQIRNLDNEHAAAWELFKMGGYGTLRGYHEDEFSNYRLAWTNYEIRYRLSTDSRAYLFFDQGFLAKADKRLKTDIFGIGAGIKVKTRLGILGLEYGLGYRDKSFSSLGLGMVHAGLDLAF